MKRGRIVSIAFNDNLRKILGSIRPHSWRPPDAIIGLSGDDVVRETHGLPAVLGRLGSLELRLATTRREIRAAQSLRYRVFYDEMSAVAPVHLRLIRRDKDAFDRVCDHLLVIDNDRLTGPPGARRPSVVGTYRLLRQDVAERNFGFYSASEFDIAPLIARHQGQRFLELGRSCVLAPYRNRKTVELLWQGIWAYVLHHSIDVLIGCASLEGTEPDKLRHELSFLHHFARPHQDWAAGAHPDRFSTMDLMPKEDVDAKRALGLLPPLVKAYLRVGARIGDGAVVDHAFGTTDVLIILRVSDIEPRYITYYGTAANRFAA